MDKMSDSRLVYSTESGRIVETEKKLSPTKGDGFIRIRRESSGRKGKGVCAQNIQKIRGKRRCMILKVWA